MRTLCAFLFAQALLPAKMRRLLTGRMTGMKHRKGRDGEDGTPMSPEMFKAWRKSLGLSQKEAALALGLRRRIVQYYEKGSRDGVEVEVPKTVRLACFALTRGCQDYSGPE